MTRIFVCRRKRKIGKKFPLFHKFIPSNKSQIHRVVIILFSLFFILSIFIEISQSQSKKSKAKQKALQHEVTVTLKLIQVFVTDRKGNPVTDLEKSDFILYDNGKLKTITDFEKHFLIKQEKKAKEKIKLKPEKKVKEKFTETETPPARKIPRRMNRKFFLLIDLYQNDVPGLKKSKTAALHFIDTQIQPTDEVSVLSYSQDRGLILHEYLTTDHQKVQEAVNRVKGVPGGMAERIEEEREWEKKKAHQFASEMREFAKYLRYIPGYKNIIFFSAGLSRNLLYDKVDPAIRDAYQEMSKELASSNSPVYTVNTGGARAHLDKGMAERGDHALKMISGLSGGKYFADVEYCEKISEEIQNVTGNYYVLGYYIDEKWDGKYHEIKIKVKRKGCRVYAQGGYFNPKPFTEFSEFEKHLHLFDLALSEKPYFQEPLYFPSIALLFSNKNESNIVLLSEIPKQKIKEVIRQRTEIITLVFDKDNNIVESMRKEIHFSTILENTIYHYIIASLNPGEYECRVVIRNLKTGEGAVGSSSVVIPGPLDSGIKLYPPLMLIPNRKAYYLKFSRDLKDKSERTSLSLNNIYPFLSNKHSPLVEEMDQGISKLLAVVRYSVIDIMEPEIELQAHLFHLESQKKISLPHFIVTSKKEGITDILLIEFQVPELPSGRYDLHLIVEETKTKSKSQTIRTFRIR